MKLNYLPKTRLERFGFAIYFALRKKYPETFFVGGMVRNILLNKKITDIDIATSATPDQIKTLFKDNYQVNLANAKLGSIEVCEDVACVEITTFRTETYQPGSRYPKVKFALSAKADYKRRDFTINALYFQPDKETVFDYSKKGVNDIQTRTLRAIGKAELKLKEDPLRIIRALRFAKDYKLKVDAKLVKQIQSQSVLLKNISQKRIEKEILKSKLNSTKNYLKSYTQKHLT